MWLKAQLLYQALNAQALGGNMTEQARRTKPSKVDLLPEDIKKHLDEMLRDKRFSQGQILDEVNTLILNAGLDEEATISRSGLSRHAQKTEAIGQRLRDLRESTKALTAQLGDKPTGDTTKLILEMARSLLFKATMQQMTNPDDDAAVDVGLLKEVMLACQRLESTAMKAHQREKDIRKAFAEEAATTAEHVATQAGMTADTVAQIKKSILGIV